MPEPAIVPEPSSEEGTRVAASSTAPVVDPPAPLPQDIPKPKPDYEELYKQSSSEAIVLKHRAEAAENKIQELTKAPTESDLKAAFPSWEFMSETEKDLGRRQLATERKAEKLILENEQAEAAKTWNRTLEATLAGHPELEGQEEAFKTFASQPTHKGSAMDVLVAAFLHKSGTAAPAAPTPAKQGLETGTGGPKTPDKPQTLSGEDLQKLRVADEKAYLEYVKTHDPTAGL